MTRMRSLQCEGWGGVAGGKAGGVVVEAWAQVGGLSRPCRGSTGRPPHPFPQQWLRAVHASCRSNTFQVSPEHSRQGRGPILGGGRCFPQAKGWLGRAGRPPLEWAVWAARVWPQREKKGVWVREFPALVLVPAPVFAPLFATVFRRSPEPFPDQGFGLLPIHPGIVQTSPGRLSFPSGVNTSASQNLRHRSPAEPEPTPQKQP